MWLFKKFIASPLKRYSIAYFLFSLCLFGCSEAKLQEAPYDYFYKVGLFGHGRGAIGDLRLNTFYFERRCDSCHAYETDKHGALGRCNQCHQPHILGWEKSIIARKHNALPLINRPYHRQLECSSCHQALTDRKTFFNTSCQHCHNHQASDIDYAHDLMDDYDYDVFSKPDACQSCHSLNGKQYADYFDLDTGEGL